MASVSKAIPEDSRNVDGIFRIVASDCLNQTNAAVATSSIRAIPAEFAKEILSFNVSIREK
ncbi:hypothetical protein H6768_04200 [Candidatus Peribacteria bacterium]|nr:hypothetical protein [Candidatus Peribacteria bacterium]